MTNLNIDIYSKKIIHGTYYPHIDGIRALAVLPVVLYHILSFLCPGGFAGVDVFFVISGYLITGGILRDLDREQFSILNFYHRRIRRILPAYFVLIAGVFIAGCAIYYSSPLRDLGDSAVMGSLFSANLYFWKIGGDYFSPNLHGNPLLHLWSLSVEEQFYLFIPLLCFVIWKLRRSWIAPTLVIISLLSLIGAIRYIGIDKQNDAFYLLHFRAWELLAGSLLSMMPALRMAGSKKNESLLHIVISWAGILMVFVPYFLISSKTPFPGLMAVPSVIGTVLLIRFGQTGWINKLLSWKPMVGTGKISYSLYLWHWPVIVFWKYVVYDQLYLWDYLGMFALSILLGYLSWRFVELPVRTSTAWTRRRTFIFAATGIALLVVIGTATTLNKGWPDILHPEANTNVAAVNLQYPGFLESKIIPRINGKLRFKLIPVNDTAKASWLFAIGGNGINQLGNGKTNELILIGDSHAGALKSGLDTVLRENKLGGKAMNYSNSPMFDLSNPDCQSVMTELEGNPEISKILIAQYWTSYMDNPSKSREMYTLLEEFAYHIKSLNRTLYIATDIPAFNEKPDDIRTRLSMFSPRTIMVEWNGHQNISVYNQKQGEINRKLKAICSKTGAILVPTNLAFREGDDYVIFQNVNGKQVSLYRDTNHLSPDGSLQVARFIMPYLFPEIVVPK